jgi:DNA-binding response OmpR family regulator
MAGRIALIVDDEISNTQLFSMMLEMEGFAPSVAHRVDEAKQLLQESSPDIIILDIMMPDASGLDLCRYVRAEPELAQIPIVIVSAKSQMEDAQEALESGANSYIVKPVSKEELLGAVNEALS